MSEQNIRVVVVGCGTVTRQFHLKNLQQMTGVDVTAVVDIDTDAAQRTAAQFGVARHYTNYTDALDDADAVLVTTPTAHHAGVAIAALDAGKAVFIEKPLALTMNEAHSIQKRAEGKIAMIGFNQRWHPLVQAARTLLRQRSSDTHALNSQLIGARMLSEPPSSWRFDPAQGGGALFELGVHHFDLWRFLTGAEFESVSAYQHTIEGGEAAVAVSALMTGGIIAAGLFSHHSAARMQLDIYGTNGHIGINGYRFDGLQVNDIHAPVGGGAFWLKQWMGFARALPHAFESLPKGGDYVQSYRYELDHFFDCVRTGQPPQTTIEDGVRALQAVHAAIESINTQRPIGVAAEFSK
ncbi:MAG: Gfo/Idh/MocA family oxidoreductase [Burkholderiales bacterium]|nr:Gfo/Idh/MocA family oxidoreductase [Anaerolineae bacterium]